MIDFETIEMPVGVNPSSPLGRAYAHWRELRLNVKSIQDELNTLYEKDAEDWRAFRRAHYASRDPRGFMASIDGRRERIEALREQMRPLRAEMHAAKEQLDSRWQQWHQAKTAIDAIREMAG